MPKNQKDKSQRERERIENKAREQAERARERAEREAEREAERVEREEREREQQPVPTQRAVMADLTLYNTLPPTVLYVLTDGSTLSTPGLPGGLAENVRDLIVRAITEQQPPAPDKDEDKDEQDEQDDEGPQEKEDGDEDGGDDVQPLPEHIDPDTVDEAQHVIVEIPEGVDPEAVRSAFSKIISEQLGKAGGV